MKIDWNRKYTTIAVYSIIVIAIAVLIVVCAFKLEAFIGIFSWVGKIAAPIIFGVAIAYVLNPLMSTLEKRLFGKFLSKKLTGRGAVAEKIHETAEDGNIIAQELEKRSASPEKRMSRRKTLARVVSLLLTYVIVLAVITGVIIAVVPSLAPSVVDLAKQLPTYVEQADKWIQNVFENNPQIAKYLSAEFESLAEIVQKIVDMIEPMTSSIIGSVSSGIMNVFIAVFAALKNILLGLIIAVYLLYSKERMIGQAKKIAYAFFSQKRCSALINGCSKANNIFKQYVISSLVDSLIIFTCMAVGMVIMGMPYNMLVAVVCGITNLIPFFGPFIGAVPCAVLILLVDPVKVIWFVIFVVILQQMDGNVIKPFLFGESMGLPAVWVLISILVGGGIFGVPGMLLGAPVFAVFYLLFAELVSARLTDKSLPTDTTSYVADGEPVFATAQPAPDGGDPPEAPPAPEG